jgi:hypothetical protein
MNPFLLVAISAAGAQKTTSKLRSSFLLSYIFLWDTVVFSDRGQKPHFHLFHPAFSLVLSDIPSLMTFSDTIVAI